MPPIVAQQASFSGTFTVPAGSWTRIIPPVEDNYPDSESGEGKTFPARGQAARRHDVIPSVYSADKAIMIVTQVKGMPAADIQALEDTNGKRVAAGNEWSPKRPDVGAYWARSLDGDAIIEVTW